MPKEGQGSIRRRGQNNTITSNPTTATTRTIRPLYRYYYYYHHHYTIPTATTTSTITNTTTTLLLLYNTIMTTLPSLLSYYNSAATTTTTLLIEFGSMAVWRFLLCHLLEHDFFPLRPLEINLALMKKKHRNKKKTHAHVD